MIHKPIDIVTLTIVAYVGVLVTAMTIRSIPTTGRSMPQTASACRSVDVRPDIDRPSTLAIEGSYDEQGNMDNMGGMVSQGRGLDNHKRTLLDTSTGQAGEMAAKGRWLSSPRSQGNYTGALDYFWLRESSKGTDPRCRVPGPAGEEGEYQITPIFAAEVKRLGYVIDVFDNESCRYGITIWLEYWAPRVFKGKPTIIELHGMYQLGPKGYRKWRERKAV